MAEVTPLVRRILIGLVVAAAVSIGAGSASAAPGDIYTYDPVSQPGNVPRILKIDPNTSAQSVVASAGNFDPNQAFGLAREASGNLIVANGANGNLVRVDPANGQQTAFSPGMTTPRAIIVDTNGDLYVTDSGTGDVFRVNPGTGARTPLGNIPGARGITFGPGGDLFINTSSDVIKLPKAGGTPAPLPSGGLLQNAQDLVFGKDGNFYLADFNVNAVIMKTPAGPESIVASGAPMVSPQGTAFDANGKLLISDQAAFTNAAIFRVEGSAKNVLSKDGMLADPRGMVAEPLAPAGGGGGTPDKTITATLSAKKKQKLKKELVIDVTCPQEACTAAASGSLTVPKVSASKRYKLKKVSKSLKAGEKGKLKLKLSKKVRNKAKRALRKRKKVSAKVTVSATDAAGNVTSKTLKIKLKR